MLLLSAISTTNSLSWFLNAPILASPPSISSFATLTASLPKAAWAPILSAPLKIFLAPFCILSFLLLFLSASNNSSMILLIILSKASSGDDSNEYSQELIQICLISEFWSKSLYIELIKEVFPLPHSPWIPIVIGVQYGGFTGQVFYL